MIPFAAVGALVASRQPRNPIGWILLAIAVTATYGADAGFYAVRAYHIDHHGLPLSRLAVFLTQGWVSMLVLLPLPILFFPDGRISRRWRWTLWAYIALIAVLIGHVVITDFGAFTDHPVRIDSSGELKQLGGNGGTPAGLVFVVLLFFAISLSWVIRQVVLYRRSSGDRRQQLKWLLAGGSFSVFGFLIAITVGSGNHGVISVVGKVGFLGLIALPISIGIGILRYRLYDIDRLISRTLSYTLLTGLLIGVFAGLVLLTTRVLPFSSPVGVAASTLAAAGLFSPLRSPLAAARRPSLQPRPLRRRGDRRGVRRSASATPWTSRRSSTSSRPLRPARSSRRTSPSGCARRRNDSGTPACGNARCHRPSAVVGSAGSRCKEVSMRRRAASILKWFSALYVVLIVIQVYLAGEGIFGLNVIKHSDDCDKKNATAHDLALCAGNSKTLDAHRALGFFLTLPGRFSS